MNCNSCRKPTSQYRIERKMIVPPVWECIDRCESCLLKNRWEIVHYHGYIVRKIVQQKGSYVTLRNEHFTTVQ